MTTKVATCSILTSDLDRLDADRRAARLEEMNETVRKAAAAKRTANPWDAPVIKTKVEVAGAVTSVSAFSNYPF